MKSLEYENHRKKVLKLCRDMLKRVKNEEERENIRKVMNKYKKK